MRRRKNLTRAGGLLSNFDDKINLGYANGLLDDGLTDSLQIIKAMRNACAHSRRHIDFKTDELRDVLALLFDDESAEVIRASEESVFLRVCFIAQFVVLSEIVKGQDPDRARQLGQDLLDRILDEAKRLGEKQRALREKRSKRQGNKPTL